MDSFLMYLLTLVTLPLSVLVIFLASKRGKSNTNLPPGSSGWPMLGENIQYALLGGQKFVSQRMKKYSPEVFQTSLMGERMAVFCGPQGNKFLFMNEAKLLTAWWPDSMQRAMMFPDFYQDSIKEATALLFSFVRDILKPEALRKYIPVMDVMAREHIEREWAPHGEVKVFHLSQKYTFDLACRLFMNVVDPVQIKNLADPFHLLTKGMFSVPIDLPGTPYHGAIKGGKIVREELLRIIRARRKEIMDHPESIGQDHLSQMLLVTDKNGEAVSEKAICNNIIGLLVASYETTSSTLTFVIKHLAELPHVYDEVLREQMEIAKTKGTNDLLTWEDIEKMKYSWNMVRESMRLVPPGSGSFREALKGFTYAGFTIPKGFKLFWNVHTTHKNPTYFSDPEKFDPSRFEGSRQLPYTYVPFGGGPRMCPGRDYARIEVLIFMHYMVKRFKLEIVIPNEKIIVHTSPAPAKGLPVRLVHHGKPS